MLKTKALTLVSVVALVFALTSCAVYLSDDDWKCIAEDNAMKAKVLENWPTVIPKDVDHVFGGACDGDNDLTYVLKEFTPAPIAEINETMSAEGWQANGDVISDPEDQPRLEFSLALEGVVIYTYIESIESVTNVMADITIFPN